MRVRCEHCHAEKLVAFSCKKRGFCPSCGARRMAETAALLADEVLPERPLRQWVLSLPIALRFLLATDPDASDAGAGCGVSHHFRLLVGDGRCHSRHRRHRCRHADSALRLGAEPERALSHDLSRWRVSAGWRSARIPPCAGTHHSAAAGLVQQIAERIGHCWRSAASSSATWRTPGSPPTGQAAHSMT